MHKYMYWSTFKNVGRTWPMPIYKYLYCRLCTHSHTHTLLHEYQKDMNQDIKPHRYKTADKAPTPTSIMCI